MGKGSIHRTRNNVGARCIVPKGNQKTIKPGRAQSIVPLHLNLSFCNAIRYTNDYSLTTNIGKGEKENGIYEARRNCRII